MNKPANPKRVRALDVRPRSFGYAVFEGPTLLLDWGVQSFRHGRNAVRIPLATKIAALFEDFRPAVVVAKEPPSRKKVNRARTGKVLELVRHKASLRGIRTRVFQAARREQAFWRRGTPDEAPDRATALAERFAELRPVLPPKRKPWESEDYRMSIFDAAALGVAYFDRQKNPAPIVPPENLLPS